MAAIYLPRLQGPFLLCAQALCPNTMAPARQSLRRSPREGRGRSQHCAAAQQTSYTQRRHIREGKKRLRDLAGGSSGSLPCLPGLCKAFMPQGNISSLGTLAHTQPAAGYSPRRGELGAQGSPCTGRALAHGAQSCRGCHGTHSRVLGTGPSNSPSQGEP